MFEEGTQIRNPTMVNVGVGFFDVAPVLLEAVCERKRTDKSTDLVPDHSGHTLFPGVSGGSVLS